MTYLILNRTNGILTEIHLVLTKVYINQVVRILFAPEFFLIFDILMFSFSIKNIALINICYYVTITWI